MVQLLMDASLRKKARQAAGVVVDGPLQGDDLATLGVVSSVDAGHTSRVNLLVECVTTQPFAVHFGPGFGHGARSDASDAAALMRRSAAPPSSGAGPRDASPIGMTIVKVVPAFCTLATEIRPSWRLTMPSTIASPRPVPRSLVV